MTKFTKRWRSVIKSAGLVTGLLLASSSIQAQCLSGSPFPTLPISPTVCDGITPKSISSCNTAGEFGRVSVVAGQTYTFKSSVTSDFISLGTDVTSPVAIAYSVQPLTWVATFTGNVRVYFHTNSSCGTQVPGVCRATSFICGPAPTCLPPASGSPATNLNVNTATLNWQASTSAPADGYEYYYSTSNVPPTATTTPSGTTAAGVLTANISSLTAGATYYSWYRAVCSSTSKSPWTSTPIIFTTQIIQPRPWTEGFASASFPLGFSASSNSLQVGSIRGVTGNPGNNAYVNLTSTVVDSQSIQTINVSSILATDVLTFDYKASQFASPYNSVAAGSGFIKVFISTNLGNTYSQIDSFQVPTTNNWQVKSYPLSAYTGQTIRIKVLSKWVANNFDVAFDNFYVGAPISCNVPWNLTETSITDISANIS